MTKRSIMFYRRFTGIIFIILNLLIYPTILEHRDTSVVKLFKIDKKYEEKIKENNRFRFIIRYSRSLS